ncbi:glycosyl transferase family 1 [Motilibacter rhizosphaerae]|uniref:Glycosyl transferase family 1 n=1 Tax=Motilibacter rhizosphaerae TaxID=598652 RepID=A0A4Q7NUQ7_9ACTN|nr:glycosyltransferase [Motilibacter rhizosphaerae]RZS90941.1 glycosyl transferase family 1 [Motilibacter rhizosphaerae]
MPACDLEPLRNPGAAFAAPPFGAPESGPWVVTATWPYGEVPSTWALRARLADEVWAPSTSAAAGWTDAGLPRARVRVLPAGVDTSLVTPEGRSDRTVRGLGSFVVLAAGGTSLAAGPDLALRAVREAFPGRSDVALVLLGGSAEEHDALTPDVQDELSRAASGGGPRVVVLRTPADEAGLARLLRSCDVVLLPTRASASGTRVAQAMAAGVPVVGAGAVAAELLGAASPAAAARTEAVRLSGVQPLHRPFTWGEPDVSELVAALREAEGTGSEQLRTWLRARAVRDLSSERADRLRAARLSALEQRTPVREGGVPVAPHGVAGSLGQQVLVTVTDRAQAEAVAAGFAAAYVPTDCVELLLLPATGPLGEVPGARALPVLPTDVQADLAATVDVVVGAGQAPTTPEEWYALVPPLPRLRG